MKRMENFNLPENAAIITCSHVLEKSYKVLYVSHDADEDEDWQFLCGIESHCVDDARIISLKEILNIDNSLLSIADLPVGYYATRESPCSDWHIKALEE